MKTVELGDYFLWEDKIVKCEWINTGYKSIGFTTIEKCPHCGGDIIAGYDMIESSSNFQNGAMAVKTIKG
jgi:hypothetical protein